MSREQNEIAQMELFNGLFKSEEHHEELIRKRLSLSAATLKKLAWLTADDRRTEHKKGNFKRWQEKDTITKLIDDAYLIKRKMEGKN